MAQHEVICSILNKRKWVILLNNHFFNCIFYSISLTSSFRFLQSVSLVSPGWLIFTSSSWAAFPNILTDTFTKCDSSFDEPVRRGGCLSYSPITHNWLPDSKKTLDSLLIVEGEWGSLISECEENVRPLREVFTALAEMRTERRRRLKGSKGNCVWLCRKQKTTKAPRSELPTKTGKKNCRVKCSCPLTWFKVPFMLLSWDQYSQSCDHSDRKQPSGCWAHDSSNTPGGYLSGDTLMATGIPVREEKKKTLTAPSSCLNSTNSQKITSRCTFPSTNTCSLSLGLLNSQNCH